MTNGTGFSKDFVQELLNASDYREFIGCFFDRTIESRPTMSYRSFANRAGFSSKTFLNDVVRGAKSIGPASIEKIELGLGLKGNLREYFRALVSSEESKFWAPRKDKVFFEKKLQRIRLKIEKSLDGSIRTVTGASDLVHVYLQKDFPEVYAVLGLKERPKSLELISLHSGVSSHCTKSILNKMIRVGMAEIDDNGNYYCTNQFINMEKLNDVEVFQKDFFRALEKLKMRFPKQSTDGKSFFSVQTMSVRSRDLPAFRRKLEQLSAEFLTDLEDAEGETVAELVVGFSHT